MNERRIDSKKLCPDTGEILRHGWGGDPTIRRMVLRDRAEELLEIGTHAFAHLKFGLPEPITTPQTPTIGEIIRHKRQGKF